MKLAPAAAVALALLAATPASAQEVKGTDEILAQMPKTLGGAPAMKMPEDIVMYMIPGDPMVVAVMVVEREGAFPPGEMRSIGRGMVGSKASIRQIIREGTFTTPKWPGVATFFGDYKTSEFFHQNWILTTGKQSITVLTSYEKKKDAKRAEALVAEYIFGGAAISAAKPAE